MNKSPKYRMVQINNGKQRQKYFKNLYDQVNKSRMAVQTITSFRNTQLNFKKKIDEIQQELHGSMSRINHESKKNVILKELICIMQGQMFDFQKTQKKQQEKLESETEKKIKKYHYDIQQILQKHNEEIAKITSLKQSASSGRSERVVFSNLFKKLEKQIKQTEDMYQETLIKSELAKDKQLPVNIAVNKYPDREKPSAAKLQISRYSETNMNFFPVNSAMNQNQYNQSPFLTLQKQKSCYASDIKRSNQHKKTQYLRTNMSNQIMDVKNANKSFIEMISKYERFLQKIKVYIGCNDLEKTLTFYQGIEEQNINLSSQIQTFNDQIVQYENLIKDIGVQKRHTQCIEYSKQLPLGSQRRIKVPTQPQSQTCFQDESQYIVKIFQQLNMRISINQINQDTLKLLDKKLDMISQQIKLQQLRFPSQKNRATTVNSQINAVDLLLEKMDRFSQCEKLLDKNLFKQEYLKEIGKNKKHKPKK